MAILYDYKPKYVIKPEDAKYKKFKPNSLDTMDSAEFSTDYESRNYSNKVNLPIRKSRNDSSVELDQPNITKENMEQPSCSNCKHLEKIISFYHIIFIIMLA